MKWWLIVGCTVTIILAVPIGIILSHPRTGHVTGQVIDANKPVPYARVIVSFKDWHLSPIVDTNPHDVGVEADENGRFAVTRKFNFRIGRISVGACSSSNKRGWTHVQEPRDSDEPVIVKVRRRTDEVGRDMHKYKYYRRHARTEFLGKGWPPPPNDSYFLN